MLVLSILITDCDSSNINYHNPNLPASYVVNLQLNLNLPQYSNLKFSGYNYVDYSQGIRGVVVFNAGNSYVAFDLACPNIAYTICTSPMTILGTNAKCSCDNTTYSLFSGQCPGQPYPMKPYRVELNGDYLYVTN